MADEWASGNGEVEWAQENEEAEAGQHQDAGQMLPEHVGQGQETVEFVEEEGVEKVEHGGDVVLEDEIGDSVEIQWESRRVSYTQVISLQKEKTPHLS